MPYAADIDMYNVYGKTNIRAWADINNNGIEAEITARITWALALADTKVDAMLKGGPYTVPFTTAPALIVDLAARKAGIILYDSRGHQDAGAATDNLQPFRDYIMKAVREIRSLKLRIDDDDNAITRYYPAASDSP